MCRSIGDDMRVQSWDIAYFLLRYNVTMNTWEISPFTIFGGFKSFIFRKCPKPALQSRKHAIRLASYVFVFLRKKLIMCFVVREINFSNLLGGCFGDA